MSKTKPEPKPDECTLDPSVLQLIQDLAQQLQAHHLGHTTTMSFAQSYRRDMDLLDRAENFLMIAQGRSQPWRIPEIF